MSGRTCEGKGFVKSEHMCMQGERVSGKKQTSANSNIYRKISPVCISLDDWSKFWGGGGEGKNIPWPLHSKFWVGGHGPPGPPVLQYLLFLWTKFGFVNCK